MRTAKKTVPTLDLFRLAAVLLVVMNHTSPLADVSAMADFWPVSYTHLDVYKSQDILCSACYRTIAMTLSFR